MNETNLLDSISEVIRIAKRSGDAIMEIYNSGDIELEMKKSEEDGFISPLTKADKVSHDIIVSELTLLTPDLHVISEEQEQSLNTDIAKETTYWIIDPIDGTKGFVKRDGEFTINIALVMNSVPVLGVVYVPAQDLLYYSDTSGAKRSHNGTTTSISVSTSPQVTHIVASKNHLEDVTKQFIEQFGDTVELLQAGSSLKICRVAEGKAELYPRLSPTTMEWDIAAADAVLRAAGGVMCNEKGETLTYGKLPELRNSGFIAATPTVSFTLPSL